MKKKNIKVIGISLASMLVVVGLAFGITTINKNKGEKDKEIKDFEQVEDKKDVKEDANLSKTIIVPDVKGMTILEATKKLNEEGFEVDSEYDEEYSEDVEKGKVLGTDLEIGSEVKRGKKITLVISLGEKPIVVDDYIGKDINEVQTELENLGLTVKVETKESEGEVNTIIEQSIEKGSELKKGDEIILYVPFVEAKYPNFVGEMFVKDNVDEFCTNNNITCTYEYELSDTIEKDMVISQSKEEMSIIKENDELTLVISKGKEE